jgi:hypothetical protein
MDLRAFFVLCVVPACSAPSPPPAVRPSAVASVATTAVAVPPRAPEIIHVAAATRPSKLVIDGDLGASIARTRASPGASALLVALSNDGLTMAADLGDRSADGIWVVVSAMPSEL